MFQSRAKLKSTQDRTRQCPLQVDTFPEYCELPLQTTDAWGKEACANHETKDEPEAGSIEAWEAWARDGEPDKAKEEEQDEAGDGGDDDWQGWPDDWADDAAGAADGAAAAADAPTADAHTADAPTADAPAPAAEAVAAEVADDHAANPPDGPAGPTSSARDTWPWRQKPAWKGPIRGWKKHGKGKGKGQKGKNQKGKNQKGNNQKGNNQKGTTGRGKGRGGRGRNQKGTGKGASHGESGGASSSTLALMSCRFFVILHTPNMSTPTGSL